MARKDGFAPASTEPTGRERRSSWGPYFLSRRCALDCSPVRDHRHTVHDHVLNADGRQRRFSVGRAIHHRRGVKDRNIRVCANTQAPLLPHRRDAWLESLRRHERHLADCFHQGEPHPLTPSPVGRGGTKALAYVVAEHPCEGPRGPRMARALLPVRVARKDGEWTVDRHSAHLLRVRVNDDGTADLAIALKALPIQPLT